MDDLNFSLLQLSSGRDVESNLAYIVQAIETLEPHVDCVLLPECALHFSIGGKRHVFSVDAEEFQKLHALACKKDLTIILGGQAVQDPQDLKVYNSAIFLDPNKKSVEVIYNKIHLFHISLDDKTKVSETEFYKKGHKPTILDIKGWKVGLGICFDLRFPTLSSYFFKNSVDVLLFPAAFLKETGCYHWHPLLKARAIETQAYVLAAAQVGDHKNVSQNKTITTFGHTLAVSPWGEVLKEKKEGAGYVHVTLSKSEIEKTRKFLPMDRETFF